jgi:cysteine-rich repeat protein
MIRRHHLAAAVLFAATSSTAKLAPAVQQPSQLSSGLELASGAQARPQRLLTPQPPRRSERAWRAFRVAHPGSWLASWDAATGVPHRIFGEGIEAPGTSGDPLKAARFAEAFLEQHLALLAPGAKRSDFTLVSNELRGDLRTVGFVQFAGGVRVLGGQLSFRFKNDRLFVIGSEAIPDLSVARHSKTILSHVAASNARHWIERDIGVATVDRVEGPFVLPIARNASLLAAPVVLRVVVETTSPPSRWDVFVAAESGELIAREQTLRFASGTVLFNAPVRYPGSQRVDYPAKYVHAVVNGTSASATSDGLFMFESAPAAVSLGAASDFVAVLNQSGPAVSTTLSLPAGGAAAWDLATEADGDAQLAIFVHTQRVKDYAKAIAPEMHWIDAKLTARANINDLCNAFYDGSTINFYRHSEQCENTGRLADVVYHEFGHGFHHRAVILGAGEFEPALSEGVSDYLAATITGDPAMGRGFFYTDAPLRHLDAGDHVWPHDIAQDPHTTGLIIGGALWHLRQNLIAKYGEAEGRATADLLFYRAMSNASDIPAMYAEILAADDDDGNITNGTPNSCEIADAFSRHGLRTLAVASSPLSVEVPTQEGFEVRLHLEGLFAHCPGDAVASASVSWRLDNAPPGSAQKAAMTAASLPGGTSTELVGVIPEQPQGQVVRYRVELSLASSTLPTVFPDNPADGMYQFFVGSVTPLYCTNFDTDPALEGWTHGLLAGAAGEGADDWQWGTPNGTPANGDPSQAFSGDFVFGNDLGHGNYDGLYQADKVNYADTPIIAVGDHTRVRLQYRRWLQVEDGYFDRARIYANGKLAWANHASSNEWSADVHHRDREWRFHDVDLQPFITNGSVRLRFELASDGGLQMGGWTLDDFCIVAYDGPGALPVCGNGVVEPGEGCDDGNTDPGDGCSASCQPDSAGEGSHGAFVSDPDESSGCGCTLPRQRGGGSAALLALCSALIAIRRRVKRSARL